jgi:hypothetical protein
MRKLYENIRIFHFQKRIVSAETICGNTVSINNLVKVVDINLSLPTLPDHFRVLRDVATVATGGTTMVTPKFSGTLH